MKRKMLYKRQRIVTLNKCLLCSKSFKGLGRALEHVGNKHWHKVIKTSFIQEEIKESENE